MTREELNKYIQRFPLTTQLALKNDRYIEDFLGKVQSIYEPIIVYRAVRSQDKFDSDDFLSTFDVICRKNSSSVEINSKRIEKDKTLKIGHFGTSVNEDINELKTALKIPFKFYKGIAKGLMKKENGLSDFKENEKHHNWYIFKDRMNCVLSSFTMYNLKGE